MILLTAQIEMLSNLTHIAFLRTAQKYYPCAFIGHAYNTQTFFQFYSEYYLTFDCLQHDNVKTPLLKC